MESLTSKLIMQERHEVNLDITYPDLPIVEHLADIKTLISNNQVVIIVGETGSGKTTQIPKICLELGLGRKATICHTQPRRIAARAVASRIATELSVPLGTYVGYVVRFDERYSDKSLLKLVTDGILLSEISSDPDLSSYEVVIIDEAHERSLNVDFLLGYLKTLIRRRPDLKLIVTSATIDAAVFSKHFDEAPVVEVGGRGYPVETRYIDSADNDEHQLIIDCINKIRKEFSLSGPAKDVLIFQPGEREILELSRLLKSSFQDVFEVVPLYARLSMRDQSKVFSAKKGKNRLVISTNVAETSLTVPNIGFVIDPGFARISRYSYRSKLQRLVLEPISQASAEQRKGRCGRIASGVCYRLYSEEDLLSREHFADPEIKRANLAQVVLSMYSMNLGLIQEFPFLDRPDSAAIRDAERLLGELGALEQNRLTRIGRQMSKFPIDPRLARMLIAAHREGCVSEVLIVSSFLAIQDPRERPLEKQGSADRAHERFSDERSEFMGILKLWNWYLEKRKELGSNQLNRVLGKSYLSRTRMHEWYSLHRQLSLVIKNMGWSRNEEIASYESIHKALMSGSLSFIGRHYEKGVYRGIRGLKFQIFPGSGLAEASPKWLMAAGIAETTRVYARMVASIEPRWIEEVAGPFIKRYFSEPVWSNRREEAVAKETVELYGLRLAEGRVVSYSEIDSNVSRELFLSEGLVESAVSYGLDFLQHNQRLISRLLEDESKERRRDLLVDNSIIVGLYDETIPKNIDTIVRLKKWWKREAGSVERAKAFFTEDMLSSDKHRGVSPEQYPSEIEVRGCRLKVRYSFSPGDDDDGVSIDIPLGSLASMVTEPFEWNVPGFLPSVIEAWLRCLPKSKRKLLAPIPEKLPLIENIIIRRYGFGKRKLLSALAELLNEEYGVQVILSDWDKKRFPRHLLMNIRVIGKDGNVLGAGRDLAELQTTYRDRVVRQLAKVKEFKGNVSLLRFPREGLPREVRIDQGNGLVIGFPALVDDGNSVSSKLLENERKQIIANRLGYARLALLAIGQTAKSLEKEVVKRRNLSLHFAPMGNFKMLKDELFLASAWRCFFAGRELPAAADSFEARIDEVRGDFAEVFGSILSVFEDILEKRFSLFGKLERLASPSFADARKDMLGQIERLVPSNVLTGTPEYHLAKLPRFLDAIEYRIDHLQGKVARDQKNIIIISNLQNRHDNICNSDQSSELERDEVWIAIEELRVALFAQELGHKKMSYKKVDALVSRIEESLGLI